MTARSPFAPYANAQLRFTDSDGRFSCDALGNVATKRRSKKSKSLATGNQLLSQKLDPITYAKSKHQDHAAMPIIV
jgi:hypothetical protein